MILKTIFVACGLAVASFFAVGVAQQQEDASLQESPGKLRIRTTEVKPDFRPAKLQETRTFKHFVPTKEQRVMDKKVAEAAKNLRQSKSGDERLATIETLKTLLRADYDDRLAGYDEYLNQLEEKLVEMRGKLQKRREAKEEMIELRIKVLESEAEDLGWPVRMSGRSHFLFPDSGNKVIWDTK